MSERLHFSVELGKQGDWNQPRKPAKGFTVVMLGEFTGGGGKDNPLKEEAATLHPVDIDTRDDLIAKLKPTLTITEDGENTPPLTLRFTCLDDFHPDGFLDQLSDYRRSTGEEKSGGPPKETEEKERSMESGLSDASESEQATLSRLLGERPLSVEQRQEAGSSITGAKKAMIEDVVRQIAETATVLNEPVAMERGPSEQQPADRTDTLRNLLHHDAFQRLEADWRSVDWLLHSTEPDPAVRFYILNMTRDELQKQQSDHAEPSSSPIYNLLRERIERGSSSESDFILIDNHKYGPDKANIAMLEWLGSLVSRFDGVLLAGADSTFTADRTGTDDPLNEWQAFRARPAATWISLLYPDVLLRLPYGSVTDPVHSFSFEELEVPWTIDELLWGNPAYAQTILLINQWANQGEREQPSLLTDMPAYSYQSEGERHLQPCAKYLLNEQQIEQLLKLGLVPVVGSRNRNAIQIPWYQNLALPVGA